MAAVTSMAIATAVGASAATTAAVGAVGAVASGLYQANQANKAAGAASAAGKSAAMTAAQNAGAQAGAALFQAEEARRQSQINAEKIMVKAREFRSSQRAVAAASGVLVDSGTAAMMEEETDNLARADALVALFEGGDKWVAGHVAADNIIKTGTSNAMSIMAEADAKANQLRNQGRQQLVASLGQAAGYGMKAYSGSKGPSVSGWGDTYKWGRE